jgi:hypothetical protein
MVWYILLIALLNLGIGFGVAVFLGAGHSREAGEDTAPGLPESIPGDPPVDTAAAMATLQAHLTSHKSPMDAQTELSPVESEEAVSEPVAVNGPEAQNG